MAEKKSCAFRTSIGGQALIEGILMRGPQKQAIVVRAPEGLVIKEEELKLIRDKYPILGLPLIFDGTLTRFSTDKYHYIRSFNFYHKALSAPLSRYLHSKGYRTRIWTVNDPTTLKAVELDGIITDRPDLM